MLVYWRSVKFILAQVKLCIGGLWQIDVSWRICEGCCRYIHWTNFRTKSSSCGPCRYTINWCCTNKYWGLCGPAEYSCGDGRNRATLTSSSSSCSWRVRRVSRSLILKMKLVPPSLPRSSYVPSSFWFILQCLFWYSVCVHPLYML